MIRCPTCGARHEPPDAHHPAPWCYPCAERAAIRWADGLPDNPVARAADQPGGA